MWKTRSCLTERRSCTEAKLCCRRNKRSGIEISSWESIYNRIYNSVGLNKVSYFSLPMKKLRSLLQKTRKVRVFVWKGIRKNTQLSSKFHSYVKNTNVKWFRLKQVQK